jgi:hypothetical protein
MSSCLSGVTSKRYHRGEYVMGWGVGQHLTNLSHQPNGRPASGSHRHVEGDVASKPCLEQCYRTILFLGSNGGGKSVSPSMSRNSISRSGTCVRSERHSHPSNGFSVLSPTRSSEVYIQEIKTLNGMTSQTMCP